MSRAQVDVDFDFEEMCCIELALKHLSAIADEFNIEESAGIKILVMKVEAILDSLEGHTCNRNTPKLGDDTLN